MTDHTDSPSDTVASRVRAVRKRRGWSVAKLAEQCAKVGVPQLTEEVIGNIERRRNDRDVTVDELLALAYALSVNPIHLLVPPDASGLDSYAITPAKTESATAVREWIRGHGLLEGADPRDYATEIPREEWYPGGAAAGGAGSLSAEYLWQSKQEVIREFAKYLADLARDEDRGQVDG